MSKTLVIYHYYEKDDFYRDNFLHFLTFGYSQELDFRIIISGTHTVDLPNAKNISYIFTENLGNDFGGYCSVVSQLKSIHEYEYFFFVNSSVRGPFLVTREKRVWVEYFIDELQSGVGIVGTTINIPPINATCSINYSEEYGALQNYSHVQTTCYLLPQKSLLYLMGMDFFNSSGIFDKEEAIRDYELKLSQLIKQNGWNMRCLLAEYNAIDYRLPHQDINPTSDNGDPCFVDAYFGRTIYPSETIFVKTNRKIYSLGYLERLTYSLFSQNNLPTNTLNSNHLKEYKEKIELVASSKQHLSYIPLLKLYKLAFKRTIRKLKGKDL